MARLMAIPLPHRGDAVLIVTDQADVMLMGFVAAATLSEFFELPFSTSECFACVEQHLESLEGILLQKSLGDAYFDESIECVEITLADLAGALAPPRRT